MSHISIGNYVRSILEKKIELFVIATWIDIGVIFSQSIPYQSSGLEYYHILKKTGYQYNLELSNKMNISNL